METFESQRDERFSTNDERLSTKETIFSTTEELFSSEEKLKFSMEKLIFSWLILNSHISFLTYSARVYGTLAFFSPISPAGFDQKASLAIISPMPDALSGTKKEIGVVEAADFQDHKEAMVVGPPPFYIHDSRNS